jgi:hypothetical protein
MAKKLYVRNNDNTEWVPLATSIPNASAYATYEYVDNELANIDLTSTINTASAAAVTYIVDAAPSTLNTLNELAAALNDDANFASTIATSLGNKLDISTASSTYLTQVNASSTYLTQINASTIYATKTELNNIDALPSQSGNTGKFLQTDGTDVSWQNVDLSSKQDYSVVLDTLGSSYISLGEGSGFLKYTRGFLGSSPTWSLDTTTYLTQSSASTTYVSKSGANYQISNTTATTVNSATPTTIASLTITTNGRPVFLVATGDANPVSAGDWNYIALYRGSTRVGKLIINQTSGPSYNNPWALTHIDVPSSGTYTYTVKAYQGVGTITYGETGNDQAPTLIAIELF